MAWVDLNADLGEADRLLPSDVELLATVTSANVACGFHAGTPAVMRAVAEVAVAHGVVVGAHVSYRDREGFGRRPVEVPADQLAAEVVEQVEVLTDAVAGTGAALAYVKAHGALYHRMGSDPGVAEAVLGAVRRSGVGAVLVQAGSAVADRARQVGLQVAAEAFADRGYRPDGTLVPRDRDGAVVDEPAAVARRALSLATGGGVAADDGSWVAVACDSLCVHGDTPGAAAAARAVRAALEGAGVAVRPFVTAGRTA